MNSHSSHDPKHNPKHDPKHNPQYNAPQSRDLSCRDLSSRDVRDDDVLMQQVRAALTPMPTVDRRAIASILTTVAQRRTSRVERWRAWFDLRLDDLRLATSPLSRGMALATMAVVVGFVARGSIIDRAKPKGTAATYATSPTTSPTASPTTSPTTSQVRVPNANGAALVPVQGATDPASMNVPVQFVLDAREAADASQLSVVGDFNNWDVTATPMTLDAGVWSASLPMSQGRHVYAFVINGDRWIADPRAPRTKDSDFGRPSSVVIVQAP